MSDQNRQEFHYVHDTSVTRIYQARKSLKIPTYLRIRYPQAIGLFAAAGTAALSTFVYWPITDD